MQHRGIPKNCIYQCLVFNLNYLYKNNSQCGKLLNSFFIGEKRVNTFLPRENTKKENNINSIFKSMRIKNYGYELNVTSCLLQLFYQITKHHLYDEKKEFSNISQEKIKQFKRVIHYIEINLSSKIELKDLANIAGYDKKYFCSLFKELSGKTPINYLNSYRIDYACELLSTTRYPITEVAFRSGIQDTSYFSKQFKKYKNCSPKEYRKKKVSN